MIEDHCPECGHLLSNEKLCSFGNFFQSNEQMDDRLSAMFDWAKENYYTPDLYDD